MQIFLSTLVGSDVGQCGELPHVLDYQDPQLLASGVIKYTCSKVGEEQSTVLDYQEPQLLASGVIKYTCSKVGKEQSTVLIYQDSQLAYHQVCLHQRVCTYREEKGRRVVLLHSN